MILKIDIKNFLIIIFIFFIYKNNIINCNDCECTSENCYSFYTESENLCLECSFQDGEKYYYLGNDNQCITTKNNTVEGKVIYQNGESKHQIYLLGNCPTNFKLLGDFCFPESNGNIVSQTEGTYKCQKYFSKENKDGFIFYNCLNNDINCTQNNNYNYNIHGDYECYPQCPDDNEFNIHGQYECYHQCPENNSYNVNGTYECYPNCPESNPFYVNETYKCYPQCPENISYYINGKYECLNDCPKDYGYTVYGSSICINKCPSNYKYYENQTINGNERIICYLNSCPQNKSFIKKVSIDGSINYRCSETCEETEFLLKQKIGEMTVTYCVDKCPDSSKYYYNESLDNENIGKRECLPLCLDNHFSKGDICFIECNNYISADISKKVFTCLDPTNNCPNLYPYLYTVNNGSHSASYCLKSCKDTQDDYFKIDNKTIYTYLNMTSNTLKECTANNSDGFYIDEISLKWVEDCKSSNAGPYHNITHCRTSCEYYYNYNDYKCMDNCSEEGNENKYLDKETNTCYKECPRNLNRGFIGFINNSEILECQSCNNPANKNEIIIGIEGYHLNNETICYENCSQKGENYYNNDGENICFYGGCNNKYNYIYKPSDANVCYQSCKDIGDGTYDKLVNNTCYQNISELNLANYYHYIDSSEIDKYVLIEKAFEECSKLKYYYLNGTQCISQCDENDYKILATDKTFGYCISNLSLLSDLGENFTNYKYYNRTKILKKECDLLEIQNLNEISQYETFLVNGSNCVDECPTDYFEYIDEKVCRNNCISDYFILEEEGNIKKCVNETKCLKYKYTNNIEKICVDKCYYQNNGVNYSYYDSNNYCHDNCSDIENYTFSYEATNDHQECLSNCPDEYYYFEDEKICLNDCGDYYYSKDNKQLCVKHCNDNEFIHPGNICTNVSCPSSAPFYYEIIFNISVNEVGTVKKCFPNCKDYESKYQFYEIGEDSNDKKCVKECKNFKYNDRCYDKCPEGLYISNDTCVPKCEPNIFKEIDGNLTCISRCPLNPEDEEIYLTSIGKCVKECPEEENYINLNGKNCSTNCGTDFFRKINKTYSNESNYDIYECVKNCSGEVYVDGTKECLADCDENLYFYNTSSLLGDICYRNCRDTDKSFSTVMSNSNSKLACDTQCNNETSKNYGYDKICRPNCDNFAGNKTINESDNSCISQCDLNSDYKYFQEKPSGNPYCQKNCDGNGDNNYTRVLMPNYICSDKCTEPNNFVVHNDSKIQLECLSKCPSTEQFAQYDEERKEYYCTNYECNNGNYTFYYLEKKICLDKCNNGDYRMADNTSICVTSCQSKNLYYDDDNKLCVSDCSKVQGKNFTKLNGSCAEKCDDDDYYNEDDLICRIKCPKDYKIDGHICRKNCSTSENNKYEDENGFCVEKCEDSNTGYIYYNKEFNNVCQNSCPKFIKGNTCVDSCDENEINNPSSNTTKFVDGKICLSSCPINKRYIIYNSEENGGNNLPQYQCLSDCTINSTYYSFIKPDIFPEGVFACKKTCPAFINNIDSKINAKLCFDDGACIDSYRYYKEVDENTKECLSYCPENEPYYISDENNIKCLSECPNNYVHIPNTYVCIPISNCTEPNKIKYSTKECVQQCGKNDKIYETDVGISYCLENCTILQTPTLYLTLDNRCVVECPENTHPSNDICECEKLFYYDKETQYKICINQEKCEDFDDYPISVFGTEECVDYCDGILSQSGKDCHRDDNYSCLENYETLITLNNGDKICDCSEKYYYSYNNGKLVKNCIQEGKNCISDYNLLITETKECVKDCPSEYSLKFQDTTCVSSCPALTEKVGNECKCSNKWYLDKNTQKIVCLQNNCPDDYPLYIKETKQCVSNCKENNDYKIYYNKECVQACDDNTKSVSTLGDSFSEKLADNKCMCKKIWYYNENTQMEECYTGNDENTNCNVFTESRYKYTIKTTNQCVSSCPNDLYQISNYCVENCEEYNNELTSSENSKICKCKDYSLYLENDSMDIIKCYTYDYCKSNGFSIIEESRQCYNNTDQKKCPDEYPIFFNGKCYKENQLPEGENYDYDNANRQIKCKYNWYNDTQYSEIKCLNKDEKCPSKYNYIVYTTNECKISNDLNLYEFNYILYPSCPENTVEESEGSNKCICDKNKFWYKKDESNGKTMLICGLGECPKDYPYQNETGKECLTSCRGKYKYNDICYVKCPELTEIGNNNECILSPVNNNLTLDNLEQTITSRLLDLYKKAENIINGNSASSQKIVTKEATVEFYGVNKKNKGHAQPDIKSDLSYIDISECVDKIYKSNGMKNNDDIIILKFDVNTAPNRYLINPVEYKFVNSRTGKELDASVCEHNSIKISYPLHDVINRYDNNKRKKKRNLEYIQIDLNSNNKDSLREKLDQGKEIQVDYADIDIFNINDKIYSDICIAVEINGKDLILEDRLNYFYPDVSLCENNCTYNHTDYINERIYCDCSFKKEFDFKREYTPATEVNTNRVKNDQGNNINLSVMKCISNLKNSKSLSGNAGFIFMVTIIIIEFLLLLIIIFYGISSLLNKLKEKMKKDENENNGIVESENIEIKTDPNNNKIQDKEKETQRKLNAPPKKRKEYGMEFIPQEYLFLFFNQNEKGIIKKVERDSVPFKTSYNTRILLEKNANINYDNIKSRGPFPPNQNILVIVDDMNESLSDYIYDDSEEGEDKDNKNGINSDEDNINGYNNNNDNKNGKNNNEDDKNKKHGIKNKNKNKNKIDEKLKIYRKNKVEFTISDYDPSDENYSEMDFDDEEDDVKHDKGFIESIKKEQRLIKKNYEFSSENQKFSNFVLMFLTEIIDKIYIIKILLFTRKFDLLTVQLSIYLLCHTLLLILLALFFDIKTIQKIWNTDNYPGLGFYLLYGFIACIVIWIIYTIMLCLWSNNDKIKDLLKLIHNCKKYKVNRDKNIKKKYDNIAWKIKFKVIVYSIIEFLLLGFCFVYFVTFCTVYTGTMSKVFKAYGIVLIEVLIIKIIYGIVLGILRKVSLAKQKKTLYNVVLFMDTYLV